MTKIHGDNNDFFLAYDILMNYVKESEDIKTIFSDYKNNAFAKNFLTITLKHWPFIT